MASEDGSVDDTFDLDFRSPHDPPTLSPGKWKIECDGLDEFTVLDGEGDEVAVLDRHSCHFGEEGKSQFETNLQCIKLVPELVRALYVATHALSGNLPDNETEKTLARKMSRLLKRCYSSPELGDTIEP